MICYSASFGNNSGYSTNGKVSTGGSTGLKPIFPFGVIYSRCALAEIPWWCSVAWTKHSHTVTFLSQSKQIKFVPCSHCRRANDAWLSIKLIIHWWFLNVYGLAKLGWISTLLWVATLLLRSSQVALALHWTMSLGTALQPAKLSGDPWVKNSFVVCFF